MIRQVRSLAQPWPQRIRTLIHTPQLTSVTGRTLADIMTSVYVVESKSFRADRLFKVTEIKQFCYFST